MEQTNRKKPRRHGGPQPRGERGPKREARPAGREVPQEGDTNAGGYTNRTKKHQRAPQKKGRRGKAPRRRGKATENKREEKAKNAGLKKEEGR